MVDEKPGTFDNLECPVTKQPCDCKVFCKLLKESMANETEHQHTDECWEPDSGCDMGRNPDHVEVASPTEVLGEDPKPSDDRNGCFLDSGWACKVCDGEIPYGHLLNCDIYKLERKLAQAEQTIDRYRALYGSLPKEDHGNKKD